MNRKLARAEKKRYSNEEKLALGELVRSWKEEYDAEVEQNKGKTRYECKRKKHVPIIPTTGYVAKAARTLYSDLADAPNDSPFFRGALKLASCAYSDLDNLRDPDLCPPKRKRVTGAGRKAKAPEVRQALFSWFVDVRETPKGRLPRRLFKLKANQLYEEWLEQNPVPKNERVKLVTVGSRAGKMSTR